MNGLQPFNDIVNPNIYHLVERIKQSLISDNLPTCINELPELFKKLHDTICLFFDEIRRNEIDIIILDMYNLCHQLLYLRNLSLVNNSNFKSYDQYALKIIGPLSKTVERSFVQEYRKIQIFLGHVDIIAELLVNEIRVFNYSVEFHSSCRNIRRSIGNALINMTYRHKESKLKLCQHSTFLMHVSKIISDVPSLSQQYGGLIRNLSWNTDELIAKQALAQTVPALIKAVLIASENNFGQKCLLSLLSALWNLAPHSTQNKRAMCESREFLNILICLLTDNSQFTVLIESASGILKYLCNYIKDDYNLFQFALNKSIIQRLLLLLNSSTFTVVLNSLSSLCTLSSCDENIKHILLSSNHSMKIINKLKNSAREDVSNLARTLLNNLNSSSLTAFTSNSIRETSNSRNVFEESSLLFSNNHLPENKNQTLGSSFQRNLRPNLIFSKEKIVEINNKFIPNSGNFLELNANTIPKIFKSRNLCFKNSNQPLSDIEISSQSSKLPINLQSSQKTKINEYNNESCKQPINDLLIETAEELTESMQCTTTGSLESLNSVPDNNEWPSTIDSASNSTIQSSVSESELPDSPSLCATHVLYRGLKDLQPHKSSSSGTWNSDNVLSRSSSNKTDCDFINKNLLKEPILEANFNKTDNELLNDIIKTVLPKPVNFTNNTQLPFLFNNIDLKPKNDEKYLLLEESIAAMMPGKSKLSISPKKEVKCNSYDQRKLEALNCSQSGIDWDEDSRLIEDDDSLLQKSQDNSNFHFNKNLFLQHSENGFDENDNGIKNNVLTNNNLFLDYKDCNDMSQNVKNVFKLSFSSDDNYNYPETINKKIDCVFPEDVVEMFYTEQLVIDCRKALVSPYKQDKIPLLDIKKKNEASGVACNLNYIKDSAFNLKTSSKSNFLHSSQEIVKKFKNIPLPIEYCGTKKNSARVSPFQYRKPFNEDKLNNEALKDKFIVKNI